MNNINELAEFQPLLIIFIVMVMSTILLIIVVLIVSWWSKKNLKELGYRQFEEHINKKVCLELNNKTVFIIRGSTKTNNFYVVQEYSENLERYIGDYFALIDMSSFINEDEIFFRTRYILTIENLESFNVYTIEKYHPKITFV